jgi:hypothetical protein
LSPSGKAVWNLLRAYVAYAGGLKTSTGQIVARGSLPGERAEKKVRCEPCLGTGKRRNRGIEQRCDDCQGKGQVLVDPQTGKRPAHLPEREGRMSSAELAAWESQTDLALTRIEALLKMNDGDEAAHDAFSSAYETGEKLLAQGSFPQLRLALIWLRDTQPALHSLVWQAVIYAPFGPPTGSVRTVCENVCDVLADRIGKIDVPGWARDAAEWRDRKDSLWRGRRPEHDEQRQQRDEEIGRRLGAGERPSMLANEYGLSSQRISQLRPTDAVATVAA